MSGSIGSLGSGGVEKSSVSRFVELEVFRTLRRPWFESRCRREGNRSLSHVGVVQTSDRDSSLG